MKIVAQKAFVANVSRTNCVFVKLYTDEGIEDVGSMIGAQKRCRTRPGRRSTACDESLAAVDSGVICPHSYI